MHRDETDLRFKELRLKVRDLFETIVIQGGQKYNCGSHFHTLAEIILLDIKENC